MNTFGELWGKALSNMKKDMPSVAINTWIKYLEPLDLTSESAFFSVPETLQKTVITGRYLDDVKRYLGEVIGFEPEIEISCPAENPAAGAGESEGESPSAELSTADGRADEVFTFDNFIVGNSNKYAHAAAVSVADNPGGQFNPLFIYGDSGLGKTHLLYAIAHRLEQRFPGFTIKYVSADDFSNQLIEAINHNRTPDFRDRYRHVNVLLMDDVQFLSRTEATQEEVFHTINTLYAKNRQIIFTSDRPPKEIKTLEERLRTRFEQGVMVDVHQPDFETRVAILQKKAKSINIDLSNEIIEYLATNLKSNVRQLEGAVKKLKVLIYLNGQPAAIETAGEAIKDLLSNAEPVSVTIERIIGEVERYFSLDGGLVRGKRQNADIVRARQIAMYLVREITGVPYTVIGAEFGNRNHTTVGYSIDKVDDESRSNASLRNTIADLRNNLKNR